MSFRKQQSYITTIWFFNVEDIYSWLYRFFFSERFFRNEPFFLVGFSWRKPGVVSSRFRNEPYLFSECFLWCCSEKEEAVLFFRNGTLFCSLNSSKKKEWFWATALVSEEKNRSEKKNQVFFSSKKHCFFLLALKEKEEPISQRYDSSTLFFLLLYSSEKEQQNNRTAEQQNNRTTEQQRGSSLSGSPFGVLRKGYRSEEAEQRTSSFLSVRNEPFFSECFFGTNHFEPRIYVFFSERFFSSETNHSSFEQHNNTSCFLRASLWTTPLLNKKNGSFLKKRTAQKRRTPLLFFSFLFFSLLEQKKRTPLNSSKRSKAKKQKGCRSEQITFGTKKRFF